MDLKERPKQLISIKGTDAIHRVMSVKDIYYIKRVLKSSNCLVHYIKRNGETHAFETRLSLADFEEVLPNQFVKANRSTIINTRHVLEYSNLEAHIMVGGIVKHVALAYPIGHKFIEL